jgi:GNAT superfamily N-acetyltransferase
VLGLSTALACWEEFARGVDSASVQRLPGVSVAVFPDEPERAVYNNAILGQALSATERANAIEAMEATYEAAGVARFAAWTHESDEAMRGELDARGYGIDEVTRAMGMDLDDLRVSRPVLELAPDDVAEHLRLIGVPPSFLAGVDPAAFHVVVARLGGENMSTAMAFDREGDCGIYNLTTLEHARRRGLGTALTALLLHDARERGCRTASLQSTEMAEGVYRAVGFRDLGRILEYVPPKV